MSEVTVKELIEHLRNCDENDIVCFGPDKYFSFYRVKNRSGVTQIEFNEAPNIDYKLLPDHPARNVLK